MCACSSLDRLPQLSAPKSSRSTYCYPDVPHPRKPQLLLVAHAGGHGFRCHVRCRVLGRLEPVELLLVSEMHTERHDTGAVNIRGLCRTQRRLQVGAPAEASSRLDPHHMPPRRRRAGSRNLTAQAAHPGCATLCQTTTAAEHAERPVSPHPRESKRSGQGVTRSTESRIGHVSMPRASTVPRVLRT